MKEGGRQVANILIEKRAESKVSDRRREVDERSIEKRILVEHEVGKARKVVYFLVEIVTKSEVNKGRRETSYWLIEVITKY